MPLDHLARLYADESYTGQQEKIILEQEQKRVELQRNHSSQTLRFSGPFASAMVMNLVETARLLTQARADTLLSAYEKSGIPFDDSALRELTNELSQFVQLRERDAVSIYLCS